MRRRVGLDIRRLRIDAGLSVRTLATASGIDHGFLARIEAGSVEASYAVLVAIGEVLGADLSVRLYPTTGPRIHDRIQAPIVEALFKRPSPALAATRRGWRDPTGTRVRRCRARVAAGRPRRRDRGRVIDPAPRAAAPMGPGQGGLAAVVGGVGPDGAGRRASTCYLTPADRQIDTIDPGHRAGVRGNARVRVPVRTADVHAALTTADAPWPGPGIVWADVEGGRARILERPPRGVGVGR